MATYTKDPDAKLDYGWDWSDYLADGEVIDTSTWSIAPTGTLAAASSPAPSKTDTTTTVWLEGGTAGAVYEVTNHVTTTGGRTDDRTFVVRVQDR